MMWMGPVAPAKPCPDGLLPATAHVSKSRRYWVAPLSALVVLLMVSASDIQARGNIAVPDKLKLVGQLRAGQYQALEKYLTSLQDRYEAEEVPEYYISIGFNAFGNSGRDLKQRFNDWVKQFPKSYAARMARGAHYWRLGMLASGPALAKGAKPSDVQRKIRFFNLARADLEFAISEKPRLTPAYGLLVNITLAEGNRARGSELARRALQANPRSRWVISTFMWSLQPEFGGSLAKLENFLTEVEREKAKYKNYPELGWHRYLAYAYGLASVGRYKDAAEVISEGLRHFEVRELYERRGLYHQRLERNDKAIEDFTRALELYPQFERYLVRRAESYFRANFGERALADLDLALKLNPLNPHSLHLRAWIYRTRYMFSHALRDLRNAMEYGSHDPRIPKARADLYRRALKDPKVAVQVFAKMARQNPNSEENWRNFYDGAYDYGLLLFKQNKKCETAELYTRFLDVCRVNEACKRRTYNLAILLMGNMVAEINCPAKPAPQKEQP